MIKYPQKKPNTICMYENWLVATHPGTEINVTPDKDAPTIPNATIAQLELLLALKKTSLLSSLPVKYDIAVKTIKYEAIAIKIICGDNIFINIQKNLQRISLN